jgi:hypothetical protein
MIALRGTVKRVQQQESEAKASSSKNANDLATGEWVWSGYWAFDSLPAPEFLENRKSKRPPHGVRPFVYKFHHIEDAKHVIVPSTTLDEDAKAEEGNRDEGEKDEKDTDMNQISSEANDRDENNIISNEKNSMVQSSKVLEQDTTMIDDKMMNDESDKTAENVGSVRITALDALQEGDATLEGVGKNDNLGIGNDDNVQQGKEKDSATESRERKSGENKTSSSSNTPPIGSSFADVDDGIYTDGGTVYPENCPKGGCWKGYFENVSKRKDRMTSRVQETFHLFFNATPPKDAYVTFYDPVEDDTSEKQDDDSKEGSIARPQDESMNNIMDHTKTTLPEGYLHVRGAGTNIFGTFEILGGFNVETSVLEIQRIYVITNDVIEEETKQTRVRSKSKPKETSPPSEKKSYFTRKRPTVLFRYGDSPEPEMSSSTKKRQRVASEPGPLSPLEGIDKEKIKLITDDKSGKQEGPVLSITVVDSAPAKISTSKRPSPDKITPKLTLKSKGMSTQPVKTSSVSPVLRTKSSFSAIPKAGKPEDARWRSAHFLYYHRHAEDSETSNVPSQSPRTSYVVYEGDMNEGGCIRDGKGVCLYNNDYIYEGDWRKNKEHGKGTLFSGDRKRKIYEGEWERGKMVSFFTLLQFCMILLRIIS